MQKDQLANFHRACQNIVDNRTAPALNYAVNYALYGLNCTEEHECHVQALYIVGNISHWRGEVAKETRKLLKDFINQTK